MKTLQVTNGDLVLDNGGRLQFAQGNSKLLQDLALWLKEPYGTGFTTPSFGSFLTSLVGGANTPVTLAKVQSEVQRVLTLYQSNQILRLQQAQSANELANWNKSEIISSINSIQVTPYQTAVNVYVSLTTLANTQTNVILSINTNGVQVQNG